MNNKILLILSLLLFFPVEFSFSHSGRTDANGGHRNRKTGGYHYHNSGRIKSTYPKKKTNYKSNYRIVSKKKKSNPFEYKVVSDSLIGKNIHNINVQINSSKDKIPTNDELKKIASNYWNRDNYNLNIFIKIGGSFTDLPWKIITKRNGSLPDIFLIQ